MTGHLALDRLGDPAPTTEERVHLEQCARCRVEARILATLDEEVPADAVAAMDAVRARERTTLTSSMHAVRSLSQGVPDAAASEAIGAHAARFEAVRWVRSGPLGPVIEVRERDGGRRLALVVLVDDGPVSRIRRYVEAFAAACPRHLAPPVVVCEAGGTWAVGTPWVGGAPIVDWLEGAADPLRPDRSRGGDLARALGGLREVAAALVHLHAAGLPHGQVAPDRVVIDVDGRAVLRDAGLWAPDAAVAPWTAPEVRAGADPTPASDVYGLGALLLHALIGRPPHDRDVAAAVAIDPDLGALAGRLRAPDPADRPAAGVALAALVDAAPPGVQFVELGLLGRGGMAEVRRVIDPAFDRALALKTILPDLAGRDELIDRFLAEARVTALLAHPGIVPVHHRGRLPDGRPFFTMKEIRGRTLAEVIADVRAGNAGWTLRRLLETYLRVCETVAYAHDRGVLHRDLKPENVMIGEYGEVLVLDWGLARAPRDRLLAVEAGLEPSHTRVGTISGTPGYMSPEQARGDVDDLSPASDVYALGAVLNDLLGPEGPSDLAAMAARARSDAPADRYPDAGALAADLQAWLDGALAREKAMADVEAARHTLPRADAGRARADTLDEDAGRLLGEVPPWAAEEAKYGAWERQDEARALRVRADLDELDAVQRLHAAFTRVPDLPEARALLADLARRDHAAAERAGRNTLREEALLRIHATALPEHHPDRARHLAWLEGLGALTLVTDPPAEVLLHRYVERHRRLVPVFERSLGHTPLRAVPLPMGSWLLVLRAEGRADVRYPVFVRRQEHWDGVPPGGSQPEPIPLPRPADLGDEDCYVPAGWTWLAGDPDPEELPARRRWVRGFVVRRFPVTNTEYLPFLDDLVAQGRVDEALRHAPGSPRRPDGLMYAFDGARFGLQPDPDGDDILPEHPVVAIQWWGAQAFAAWAADRAGLPWRLPADPEWEKAARGVDLRLYAWGDHLDPAWCNMRFSGARSQIAGVDTYPVDESPYGVRGMTGNVRDWSGQAWLADPTEQDDWADLRLASEVVATTRMTSRGGDWFSRPRTCRLPYRSAAASVARQAGGLRLFRSWP